MKEIKTMRRRRWSFLGGWIIAVHVLIAVFIIFGQAVAKDKDGNEAPQDTSWHPGNAKNVNDYFRGKYNFDSIGNVHSTVRSTQYGPKGRLSVVGIEIKLENPVAISGQQGQARGIAQTFLQTEAEAFGITNMEEIREYKVIAGENDFVDVLYHRYIGDLELAISLREVTAARILVTVGPNNSITSFDADLVPMSPEAYEATTKPTLPESKIRHIIEMDLKSGKVPVRERTEALKHLKLKKYAIPDPPYVVWGIENIYRYTVDAFTGEILWKIENWGN